MAGMIGQAKRMAGVMLVMLVCVSMVMAVSARHAPGPYHADAPTPFAWAPDYIAYTPEGAPLSSPVVASPAGAPAGAPAASYPVPSEGEYTPASAPAPDHHGF